MPNYTFRLQDGRTLNFRSPVELNEDQQVAVVLQLLQQEQNPTPLRRAVEYVDERLRAGQEAVESLPGVGPAMGVLRSLFSPTDLPSLLMGLGGAAGTAGAGRAVAGRAVTGLGDRALKAGARMAGAAAGTEAGGLLAGEPPGVGALIGLTGQALGEGVTEIGRRAVGPRLQQGMDRREVAAGLNRVLDTSAVRIEPDPAKMFEAATPAVGQRARPQSIEGAAMQEYRWTLDEALRAAGDPKRKWTFTVDPNKPSPFGDEPITLKEALEMIRKPALRSAQTGDPRGGFTASMARGQRAEMIEAVVTTLRRNGFPIPAQMIRDANTDLARRMFVARLLRGKGVFQDGQLNMSALQRRYRELAIGDKATRRSGQATVPPEIAAEVEDILFRGAGPSEMDVTEKLSTYLSLGPRGFRFGEALSAFLGGPRYVGAPGRVVEGMPGLAGFAYQRGLGSVYSSERERRPFNPPRVRKDAR